MKRRPFIQLVTGFFAAIFTGCVTPVPPPTETFFVDEDGNFLSDGEGNFLVD